MTFFYPPVFSTKNAEIISAVELTLNLSFCSSENTVNFCKKIGKSIVVLYEPSPSQDNDTIFLIIEIQQNLNNRPSLNSMLTPQDFKLSAKEKDSNTTLNLNLTVVTENQELKKIFNGRLCGGSFSLQYDEMSFNQSIIFLVYQQSNYITL